MGYRTSKFRMILRVATIPWMVILLICIAAGIAPTFGLLFFVVAVIAGMMWFFSLICRLFGFLFLRNDQGYQEFRRNGGDPYFDLTLPPGVNNDSWAVRIGGKPEPDTAFVPPKDWVFQCHTCGARNPVGSPDCWYCHVRFVDDNASWAEQCGGKPEPQTDFVPPKDWLLQCNTCCARNHTSADKCWHCGANLKNTATGRILDCWQCHQQVQEMNMGDLENGGVFCPHCGAHMIPTGP